MDTSKSLQELENFDMGDPKGAPTDMIQRCLTLHRTPLNQWNAEDCRLMLGQKFNPHILVPLALRFLNENLFEGGTMIDGALIHNVLRLPTDFWIEQQDLWWQVSEIVSEVEGVQRTIEELEPEIERFKTLQVK